MLKRALFTLVSLLILFSGTLLLVPQVHAQFEEDSVTKQLKEFNNRRRGDQMNLETWYSGKDTDDPDDPSSIGFSDIILLDLYSRMQGKEDFSNPLQTIQKLLTDSDGNINTLAPLTKPLPKRNSLAFQLGSIIGAAVKSPPVSFNNYIASVRQNISKHGIVQPAYAQGTGFGFQNLLPVLPIWKAFRNVAYFVFILVFVLYGFMIMFRMKINPQNVATFQTAIPKIVTTLIVITFAYAIAGFMVDLMFVVFNLILSIFQTSGIITSPDNFFVKLGSGQFGILSSWIMSNLLSFVFVPSALINVLTNLPGSLSIILDILLTVAGLGLLLRIIIVFAVIYTYIKLIFKLFEAYITVIIQVIFSPLILLPDVLPGSQAFGGWIRNIAANLSVFPVTMVMLLLSYIFMIQPLLSITGGGGISGIQNLTTTTDGLSVPLIGGLGTGLGDVKSPAILAVIGFFILLMASKYVDMVRDALKVPPFKYGSALGEALNYGIARNEALAKSGYQGLPIPRGIRTRMAETYGPAFDPTTGKPYINPETGKEDYTPRVSGQKGGINIQSNLQDFSK